MIEKLYGDLPDEKRYEYLFRMIKEQIEGEEDALANLSNIAAFIAQTLPGINWAGFYIRRGDDLVLGPFQGNAACVRIPVGKGVCGKAAAEGRPVNVRDVLSFDGHIACDSRSRSEIVLPIVVDGETAAVLDIDAPTKGRFTEIDEQGLLKILPLLEGLEGMEKI